MPAHAATKPTPEARSSQTEHTPPVPMRGSRSHVAAREAPFRGPLPYALRPTELQG
eukprot:gene11238-9786_t